MSETLISAPNVGSVGAGVGSTLDAFIFWLEVNGLVILIMAAAVIAMGIVYYITTYNKFRVLVVRQNGKQEIFYARLKTDKDTKEEAFVVPGWKLQDGKPPRRDLFYTHKAFIFQYPCITAVEDANGILHFVRRGIFRDDRQESTLGYQFIDQRKVSEYLRAIQRQREKFKRTPDKNYQMLVVSSIIVILILAGLTGWNFFQQRRIEESRSASIAVMARSMEVTTQVNQQLAVMLRLNITGTGASTAPQGDGTLITPFNNVVS